MSDRGVAGSGRLTQSKVRSKSRSKHSVEHSTWRMLLHAVGRQDCHLGLAQFLEVLVLVALHLPANSVTMPLAGAAPHPLFFITACRRRTPVAGGRTGGAGIGGPVARSRVGKAEGYRRLRSAARVSALIIDRVLPCVSLKLSTDAAINPLVSFFLFVLGWGRRWL